MSINLDIKSRTGSVGMFLLNCKGFKKVSVFVTVLSANGVF